MEAIIQSTCTCSIGFVETGKGENNPIIQLWGVDSKIRYSNRQPFEEMDDLEMICVRCGCVARWGTEI